MRAYFEYNRIHNHSNDNFHGIEIHIDFDSRRTPTQACGTGEPVSVMSQSHLGALGHLNLKKGHWVQKKENVVYNPYDVDKSHIYSVREIKALPLSNKIHLDTSNFLCALT